MRDKVCKASLLYLDDLALAISFRQVVQMDDAGDRGGDQPREAKQAIDHVAESIQQEIPVIRVTMLKVVAGVVNQMPRDPIVKVEKNKGKGSRSGGSKDSPRFSIQITELGKPGSRSRRSSQIGALIGPEAFASISTAVEGGFEIVGDLELGSFDIRKANLFNNREQDDSSSHSKVMDKVTDVLVAEITGRLETTEEEDGGGGTEANNDTEQGGFVHTVVFVGTGEVRFKVVVCFVRWVQVPEKTSRSKGTSHGIQNKDRYDEEGENVIGESSCKLHVASEIHESCDSHVPKRPNRYPCIKRKKGHANRLRKIVDDSRHDQYRPSGTNNHGWHTTEQRKEATSPAGSQDTLNGADSIVHVGRINRTKR